MAGGLLGRLAQPLHLVGLGGHDSSPVRSKSQSIDHRPRSASMASRFSRPSRSQGVDLVGEALDAVASPWVRLAAQNPPLRPDAAQPHRSASSSTTSTAGSADLASSAVHRPGVPAPDHGQVGAWCGPTRGGPARVRTGRPARRRPVRHRPVAPRFTEPTIILAPLTPSVFGVPPPSLTVSRRQWGSPGLRLAGLMELKGGRPNALSHNNAIECIYLHSGSARDQVRMARSRA